MLTSHSPDDPLLPIRCLSVEKAATEAYPLRAETESLQNVGSSSHPAVNVDLKISGQGRIALDDLE